MRLGEDGGVGDDEDAVASGGGEIVSKPKGSAAVLQKVFGADAGTKAAQNMQKANQIVLPKVPTSAKVPGRITESEQLRIDITRQLVPSYFNLVRRNVSRICLGCVSMGCGMWGDNGGGACVRGYTPLGVCTCLLLRVVDDIMVVDPLSW